MPLTQRPPVFDTVVAVGAAIVVFARTWSDSLEPARAYRSLAARVGGWPEAFAPMAMHVAVWAVCVTMLPALVGGHR
jgi:hypothetical protein